MPKNSSTPSTAVSQISQNCAGCCTTPRLHTPSSSLGTKMNTKYTAVITATGRMPRIRSMSASSSACMVAAHMMRMGI